MWPKMLFELLPHAGRLIPMAEKFFATRGVQDQQGQAALAALADTIRTEMATASEGTATLERAVRAQSEMLSSLATELTLSRAEFGLLQERMRVLEDAIHSRETNATKMKTMLIAALGLLLIVLMLLMILLVRTGGR